MLPRLHFGLRSQGSDQGRRGIQDFYLTYLLLPNLVAVTFSSLAILHAERTGDVRAECLQLCHRRQGVSLWFRADAN